MLGRGVCVILKLTIFGIMTSGLPTITVATAGNQNIVTEEQYVEGGRLREERSWRRPTKAVGFLVSPVLTLPNA
jgi:hypothetical protein